uniref:Lipocalin n=1 Tax=Rhipicephalus zambeziensis TaxID=60191 RepID=A0A224YLJ2_9ACAR
MRLRSSFHIFLLAFYLTTAECKPPFVNKIYNIRKFLRTHLPIWTFVTTGGSHCLCQADVTQHIDEKGISYIHYFLSQGHFLRHTRMSGYFHKKNIMYVKPYGSGIDVMHEVVYIDKIHKCAVVKVSSMISPGSRMNKLDLRVWNSSSVATSARPCLPEFRRLARIEHLVYKDMCQNVLGRGRPSQDQDVDGRKNPQDHVCRNYG